VRILYGITANGNGHLSRSRRIVRMLRERGHELELVISGEPGKTIMDNEELAPYRRFAGFSFADKNGSMSALETLRASKPGIFLRNLLRDMPTGSFDLAVTDYEPLTAWYARLHGIPSVGVCHMYSFIYPGVPVPPSRWYEKLTFRWLAPADIMLGTHWFPYHRNVIPPFVPPVDTSAEDGRLVLVYLPWEAPESYLEVLKSMGTLDFIVYGSKMAPVREGNIEMKPASREGFLADLGRCSSIIANAGFALASEAASLGKRLMLKPYAGQVEQEHNALEAERLGLATRVESITTDAVESFFATPKPIGIPYPDITPLFVSWLETKPREFDEPTHLAMWGNVSRETPSGSPTR
jgi:uncharacterized protein (TIGR00661 family)